MSNLYRRFASILPNEPRDKGRVIAVHSDGVTVELVTGDHRRVRGTAAIDDHVFIRGDRIEGPAPALNGLTQEI
ncbi:MULTISPECIES: hypothetical protein [Marinobacter]|uniref:TRAM domain-containing protein n=1 Tax=Marinobacter xestospongiae TaxID=994319 RepID=A0ABU3VTF3_9GAMM|nr:MULTISPECIES: hypothetical protein [Marinobacter]MCK7569152.1 hypothetical protein [Marinobacter xestospongiae]MCK7569181.1 hypothetical protein [Marinobacter xestospongiae]MDV2077546.1 hypothetical protein [Marinobacter xestospongiae]UDL03966.1 hypothetical protein J2887_14755 [Marinobacter sp. CA1]